jgi:hypothetical protein
MGVQGQGGADLILAHVTPPNLPFGSLSLHIRNGCYLCILQACLKFTLTAAINYWLAFTARLIIGIGVLRYGIS